MTFFNDIANIIADYHKMILRGVGYTLLVSLISTIIGLILGILIGVFRTIPTPKNKFLRALKKIADVLLSAYIEVFRGTPMMVQAMVIFWGLSLPISSSRVTTFKAWWVSIGIYC